MIKNKKFLAGAALTSALAFVLSLPVVPSPFPFPPDDNGGNIIGNGGNVVPSPFPFPPDDNGGNIIG